MTFWVPEVLDTSIVAQYNTLISFKNLPSIDVRKAIHSRSFWKTSWCLCCCPCKLAMRTFSWNKWHISYILSLMRTEECLSICQCVMWKLNFWPAEEYYLLYLKILANCQCNNHPKFYSSNFLGKPYCLGFVLAKSQYSCLDPWQLLSWVSTIWSWTPWKMSNFNLVFSTHMLLSWLSFITGKLQTVILKWTSRGPI